MKGNLQKQTTKSKENKATFVPKPPRFFFPLSRSWPDLLREREKNRPFLFFLLGKILNMIRCLSPFSQLLGKCTKAATFPVFSRIDSFLSPFREMQACMCFIRRTNESFSVIKLLESDKYFRGAQETFSLSGETFQRKGNSHPFLQISSDSF